MIDKTNKKYVIITKEVAMVYDTVSTSIVMRAPAEIVNIDEEKNTYTLRFLYQVDLKDLEYSGKPDDVYTHEELIDVMCSHRI
jgi:hypothetical protein